MTATAEAVLTVRAYQIVEAGGLRVKFVDEMGRVYAEVDGRRGRYQVRRTVGGRWSCGCTASFYGAASCSHREAVKLVADPER